MIPFHHTRAVSEGYASAISTSSPEVQNIRSLAQPKEYGLG